VCWDSRQNVRLAELNDVTPRGADYTKVPSDVLSRMAYSLGLSITVFDGFTPTDAPNRARSPCRRVPLLSAVHSSLGAPRSLLTHFLTLELASALVVGAVLGAGFLLQVLGETSPSPTQMTRADYHSLWVSQSAYPTVKTGTTSEPITLTFRNTGSQPWISGVLGQQLSLGIAENAAAWSPHAFGWPSADRVAVQEEATVRPGQSATFTFQVRAPTAAGTYVLRLRPVVDGTVWLEDQGVFVLVTVVP
jgi:hypothetical protein